MCIIYSNVYANVIPSAFTSWASVECYHKVLGLCSLKLGEVGRASLASIAYTFGSSLGCGLVDTVLIWRFLYTWAVIECHTSSSCDWKSQSCLEILSQEEIPELQ